jgi:hypothetical protein
MRKPARGGRNSRLRSMEGASYLWDKGPTGGRAGVYPDMKGRLVGYRNICAARLPIRIVEGVFQLQCLSRVEQGMMVD